MRDLSKVIVFLVVILAWAVEVPAQERKHQLDGLISRLYQTPWDGAVLVGESPTEWDFGLTEPMKDILEVGSNAQDPLLDRISDPKITDQVIFLLGGVGNEKVIEPIISSMVAGGGLDKVPNSQRINRAANLALTNITVADVIWHHGGGIVVEGCQGRQKECWQEWWTRNKATFSINTIKQSRCYSNYPNYGIYRNKQ